MKHLFHALLLIALAGAESFGAWLSSDIPGAL